MSHPCLRCRHTHGDWPAPSSHLASLVSEVTPAALIGLFLTVTVAVSQLMPLGEVSVLVRLPDKKPTSALVAAAAADATLVLTPSPGFAVLHGDATRIRKALGLAVLWKGNAPCSTQL